MVRIVETFYQDDVSSLHLYTHRTELALLLSVKLSSALHWKGFRDRLQGLPPKL